MASVDPTAPEGAIRLAHLSFTYLGHNTPALCDVSLTISCGEMVVIMGATGAGKTTLAKCLNRTIPAFRPGVLTGEISILGRCLRDEGVADLAGVVGLVSQDFEAQLFATNVVHEVVFGMEQFGLPPPEMQRRVPRVLEAVGLAGFERRDPTTLSGGEKQRLAIAATLALQPSILVFDEPTTDLDPLGKLEIFTVLANMRREGYTLVVVEHEFTAAECADRLIVMSAGRIVADDTPERILSQVDFLERHGIRAPDLSRLAAPLRLVPVPRSLDEAEAALRAASPPVAKAVDFLEARPSTGSGRAEKPNEIKASTAQAEPFDRAQDMLVEAGFARFSAVPAKGGQGGFEGALEIPLNPPPSTLRLCSGQASLRTGSSKGEVLVRAEDVTFSYDAGTHALDGVSLTIRCGEFVALIGQNGSGKTTLAKHFNGLLRPSAGRVLLRSTDVRTLPLNHVASDVGYVFQNPDHQIFASTVYDEAAFGPRNVGLSPEEIRHRVHAALEAVGLVGSEQEDPFLLGKGHRQRLAVASLLALRPSLLILDEPTTGLDYSEQRRMMDLVAQLHARGMTVLMITHSPWVVAEYAQRGVLMSGGRILFDGPLRLLFAEEALLEQAHFRAPDITRLGRRFGFTPLSVGEFARAMKSSWLSAES